MQDILFVKTSSLGDVIHHMPAVAEARVHFPSARLSWVVEEGFAPLVRLHPAVDQVIPVGMRRWLRHWHSPAAWREAVRFRRELAARSFDIVIDSQGLLKSALVSRCAQAPRHGYDARSIREPLAARFYDVRHSVSRQAHAITRNRILTARALGYEPRGEPCAGLDRAALADVSAAPYAVLLHATAQDQKLWPETDWRALAADLGSTIDLALPWGTSPERERALRIARDVPRARVPERMALDDMARLIAGAAFVVGVDTGLLHLAAALGVPLVAIFLGSDPVLTGPVGEGPIAILGSRGAPPSLAQVRAAIEEVTC